jgi:hypothetical protein
MTDWSGAIAPASSGETVPPRDLGQDDWSDAYRSVETNALLEANPGFLGHIKNFFKFAGHGLSRGVAEDIGLPVDIYNAAGSYFDAHPETAKAMTMGGMEGGFGLIAPPQPTSEFSSEKFKPVHTGSTESVRGLMTQLGIPTSTPKEEGVTGAAARWGDVLGEFGGANAPFVGLGVGTGSIRGGTKIASELAFGALAPGTAAGLGMEIAGEEHEAAGKAVGGVLGSIRASMVRAGAAGAVSGASWLHDFLGFGTGARAKVGEAITKTAQDLPTALSEIEKVRDLSPGAAIPVDIASGDPGLMALRRTILAKDAELAGDYQRMQKATQDAIKEDAKLSRANFPDTQAWLEAKQQVLEQQSQMRLLQATTAAEQATQAAFSGTVSSAVEANLAKHAYALNLRGEILSAEKDLDAVTRSKWQRVNKELPVDVEPVYDEIAVLESEHAARRGEGGARFPSEVVGRFYETREGKVSKILGPDGAPVQVEETARRVPKFGPGAKLEEVIDLESDIGQQMRLERAQLAPDRVYLSYLTRISNALQKVKENIPEAATNAALKEANAATRFYHDTFTRGPIGKLLGHDVAGGLDVSAGDTVRRFLSQGPAGVDSFNAMMRALGSRTGKAVGARPTMEWQPMLERYIRQDFYDNAMANGMFSKQAAEQWMRNNAGALGHPDFGTMRKEFEGVIEANGRHASAMEARTQDREMIAKNRAALFLNGNPGLFNGALKQSNRYQATKELLEMTRGDPTGRATEGLGQMAFDHMMAKSTKASPGMMEQLSGRKISNWVEENQGVIRALDEELPGIKQRFNRVAETARLLERFRAKPEANVVAEQAGGKFLMLRDVVARVTGARVFSHLGHGGASIQTAHIGSQAFRELAAKLTPDEAMKILRRAMTDPVFFKALTTEVTARNAKAMRSFYEPYFISMGIPIAQPLFGREATEEPQ